MNNEEMENRLTGQVVRGLTRLFYAAIVATVTIIGIAAGGAAWVTRTDFRLEAVQGDVAEIKQFFIKDFTARLRELEMASAPGVLPNADQRLKEHEQRIDELEKRAGP